MKHSEEASQTAKPYWEKKLNLVPKEAGGQCDLSEHYSSKLVITKDKAQEKLGPQTPALLPGTCHPTSATVALPTPPCRPRVRVTGRAVEPRPAVRPDTSRQENGGCGRVWETGRKLKLAAPSHLPHEGGGNAGSKTRDTGQERTPKTQARRTTRETGREKRAASKGSPRCHLDTSAS